MAMTDEAVEELKLTKRIRKGVWNALYDFEMISEGDKVMVCLSGGKDSYTMLDCMLHVQAAAPFDFEIVAVNLDQKQPDFPEHILPAYLEEKGVNYHIIEEDTYSVVKAKLAAGKTMCSLCSRLRRGNLYEYAKEIGANVVALGHHRDDIVETLLLNMFFAGKMETMPPKYRTDDGAHIVIRPLAYVKEKDIAQFSEIQQYPIIPCNLCGSQDNMQRKIVKNMLTEWDKEYPGRSDIIFRSMTKVHTSHLLDPSIYDFKNLESLLKDENAEVEELSYADSGE